MEQHPYVPARMFQAESRYSRADRFRNRELIVIEIDDARLEQWLERKRRASHRLTSGDYVLLACMAGALYGLTRMFGGI